MVYVISNGTKEAARKHGLRVEPSRLRTKKISVFKGDEYLGSVGAIGYDDFYSYKRKYGQEVANEHRRRYLERHEKDRYSGKGKLAAILLWNA
jgi:hypothetical protein